MADVALHPTFPAAELERLRKERLTRLLQARDDPAAIIEIAFPRIVFGEKHRYGTAGGGGAAEVKAMTLDDLKAFHQHVLPARALDAARRRRRDDGDGAMPLLERAFGAWKGDGPGPAGRGHPDCRLS